jgi:hypothetical protein
MAAHAGAFPGCGPLPGAGALWERPAVRFILVGEMHGTGETPVIFRDLACTAAAGKRLLASLCMVLERTAARDGASGIRAESGVPWERTHGCAPGIWRAEQPHRQECLCHSL